MGPQTMLSRASLLLVLFLLVSAPLSALAEGTSEEPLREETEVSETTLSEQERLALAASHWQLMPEASMVSSSWNPSTGLLHLAGGSFDPTMQTGPELPTDYQRTQDMAHTGMAVVQLDRPDGTLFDQLVKKYDLSVLDILHDEGWLVRLPPSAPSVFQDLGNEEGVRWVGQHQPGWRVAPSLLVQPAGAKALAIIPTPDLSVGGYAALATDLVRFGAVEASCDAWMCHAAVDPNTAHDLIRHLAHDGRILWTEPSSELRVHNALAWSIAGVQGVANNATFTLDGSGEMIAIADTGLDQNHPDLTGRVAATYTQFGLDPSAADSNSGHGTHIAISVLGNGTGDAGARGVAPAASLVMYALEHDPTGTFGRIGSIYDMLRDAEQMTAESP